MKCTESHSRLVAGEQIYTLFGEHVIRTKPSINVCKTVSKNVFLMSQLKRYVNSQTLRIFFFNAHIMPYINFSSTLWDGCDEIQLSKLNSLHCRAAKLLNPD